MKQIFLSTASLILTAAVLSACSDTPAPSQNSTPTQETQISMPETLKLSAEDIAAQDAALTPHLYLEEVLGEPALDKVKAWNARSLERLEADPLFDAMQTEALEILNSKDKIPYVSYRGGAVHNFWQDAQNVRGVWRTTSLGDYQTETPNWTTVLDYDALAKTEDKNWVYKGNNCLAPDYTRCIINLSDGGKDAVVRREFDTSTQSFVEDGFITPESKGTIDWVDENTVVVGLDFGKDWDGGTTLTDSGYPMIAKIWTRGQPVSAAAEFGRGERTDVGFWAGTWSRHDGTDSPSAKEIIGTRSITFYDSETFWYPRESLKPVQLPIPQKSDLVGEFKGQALLRLNEDWRGHSSGELVSFSMDGFMQDGEIETVTTVYKPNNRSSIDGVSITKSKLLVTLYENVQGRAYAFDFDGSTWSSAPLPVPEGSVSITAANPREDMAFINTQGFLTPSSLWTYDVASDKAAKAKFLPDWFDASSMQAEQFFATSTDGEQIPYFVVRQKGLKLDGTNPTLLYGYGGFEVSLNPSYSATRGKLWIERGGVYVLANIRGGGEFGPDWHQAGLKTKRQIIYDDFIAVAEDLIAKEITSPAHLGIEGGSNGGLLMGVMFTQRPDLFNAVVCAVPLLDMMRYHTLLAGASWMGEYGDPEDGEEGAFLRSISPYHNIDAETDYPEMFFVTSTKDDRVHPGHARKMAARLEDLGKDFLYYENIDGGHSASANLAETAKRLALQHTYLMQKLSSE